MRGAIIGAVVDVNVHGHGILEYLAILYVYTWIFILMPF